MFGPHNTKLSKYKFDKTLEKYEGNTAKKSTMWKLSHLKLVRHGKSLISKLSLQFGSNVFLTSEMQALILKFKGPTPERKSNKTLHHRKIHRIDY